MKELQLRKHCGHLQCVLLDDENRWREFLVGENEIAVVEIKWDPAELKDIKTKHQLAQVFASKIESDTQGVFGKILSTVRGCLKSPPIHLELTPGCVAIRIYVAKEDAARVVEAFQEGAFDGLDVTEARIVAPESRSRPRPVLVLLLVIVSTILAVGLTISLIELFQKSEGAKNNAVAQSYRARTILSYGTDSKFDAASRTWNGWVRDDLSSESGSGRIIVTNAPDGALEVDCQQVDPDQPGAKGWGQTLDVSSHQLRNCIAEISFTTDLMTTHRDPGYDGAEAVTLAMLDAVGNGCEYALVDDRGNRTQPELKLQRFMVDEGKQGKAYTCLSEDVLTGWTEQRQLTLAIERLGASFYFYAKVHGKERILLGTAEQQAAMGPVSRMRIRVSGYREATFKVAFHSAAFHEMKVEEN